MLFILGSVPINLSERDAEAVTYRMNVFKFNQSTGNFDILVRQSGLPATSFPFVIENIGVGTYVVRVDSQLKDNQERTFFMTQFSSTVQGEHTETQEVFSFMSIIFHR